MVKVSPVKWSWPLESEGGEFGAEKTNVPSQKLADWSLPHGFFGREGGISQGPYAGLNGAINGTRDHPDHVQSNRHLALQSLGLAVRRGIYPRQEHTSIVRHVTGPDDQPTEPADALVTRSSLVALCVLTADCAPVLLWDKGAGVVGAVHAGWRGALAGIVDHTVEAMVHLGASAATIEAVIGPTIRQPNYPVSLAWVETYGHSAGMDGMIEWMDQQPYFNLAGYVTARLSPRVGRVYDLGLNTYGPIFFSRRYALDHAPALGESGGFSVSDQALEFGRNMSWIALPDPS